MDSSSLSLASRPGAVPVCLAKLSPGRGYWRLAKQQAPVIPAGKRRVADLPCRNGGRFWSESRKGTHVTMWVPVLAC